MNLMQDLQNRILYFRELLEKTIRAQQGKTDKYSKGVLAIARTLLKDYDNVFSGTDKHTDYLPLIRDYCHKWPACPICGAKMYSKSGRYGDFYGCSQYPDCLGIRSTDKKPSMNAALKIYLAQKVFEDKMKDQLPQNRFSNLEL